ncbi:MAG: GNAT family N-acetyltransferase [Erysipelotrichaceae bacterium]|nr:GNAT family N-acetyltransferase [Erysipelotrichaceae bacterium]
MKKIETERLLLRKVKLEDAQAIFDNWASDEETSRYVMWDKHVSLKETKNYVGKIVSNYKYDFYFDWLVCLKEDDEPIGEISVVNFSLKQRICEIGYCYGKKYWNKGYASEALKAVIDYMFSETNIDKVYSRHLSNNEASGKVMKKAGMKYDGELENHAVDKLTGQRVSIKYYSIEKEKNYKTLCPVCGSYWFNENHEICPICKWECDPVQNKDENYEGGANKLSLAKARKEYHEKEL